jgi:hypothetical protein
MRARLGWRALTVLPLLIVQVRFLRRLSFTRKNLLFTRRLALEGARAVCNGSNPTQEMRRIEAQTGEMRNGHTKGYYTDKVRKRQLREIELLMTHYVRLLGSESASYEAVIRDSYTTKKEYRSFLKQLQEKEQEVIQASVRSLKKGSKRERIAWFEKVRETTEKVRREELERIYPDH